MTDDEKAAVAELNKRLMAKCACDCDADGCIAPDEMCLEHRTMIDDAVKAERERIIQIADQMIGSHNITKRLRERVEQR